MKPKPDATIALKPKLPFDFDLSSKTNRLDKDYTHTAYFEKTLYKCLEIEEKSSLISIVWNKIVIILLSIGFLKMKTLKFRF